MADGVEYTSDKEKSNLFAEKIEKTFSNEDNKNFNRENFEKIEKLLDKPISEFYENTKILPFIKKELNREMKKLNKKTSIDQDGISNRILKMVPDCMKELILLLFNRCLNNGEILKYWKLSRIMMKGKKGSDRSTLNG